MKQTIQYTCSVCRKQYQLSEGVECVNKFGWLKPDKFKEKECKECSGELTNTPNYAKL